MAFYALDQGCTFGAPSGGQTALAERLAQSAFAGIDADCTEICVDSVNVTQGGGGCSSSIETCGDGIDNDCDGEIDEGCGGDGDGD